MHDFWDHFSANGHAAGAPLWPLGRGQSDVGTLGLCATVAPGETVMLPFFITWHFPNFVKYWRATAAPSCGVTSRRRGRTTTPRSGTTPSTSRATMPPTRSASTARRGASTTRCSPPRCRPTCSTPSPARPPSCTAPPCCACRTAPSTALRAATRDSRLLRGLLHPRVELCPDGGLPLPRPGALPARRRLHLQHARGRPHVLPPAAAPGQPAAGISTPPPTARWAAS